MKRAGQLALIGFFVAPMVWLLLAPISSTPTYSLAWPQFTIGNFVRLMEARNALMAFVNSFILAGAAMVIVAVTATLAGYALSRHQFPGRDLAIYGLVLMSSVVTGITAIVPLFTLLLWLGLLDTHLGVILVLAGGLLPSGLFILKDFVDKLPRAYEEASLVDGATPWQTFQHVVAPLLAGGTGVVAMLTFVNAWGNFLTPYILLRSPEMFPAAVAIYSFFNEVGLPFINLIAAYSLLYTVPVLALYLIIQKVFGFDLVGGIKG